MRVEWFTAAELAEMKLRGLPRKQKGSNPYAGIHRLAKAEGWADARTVSGEPLARRRKGRGGGFEYHYTVLPTLAQVALLAREVRERAAEADAQRAEPGRAEIWRHFEAATAKSKDRARRNLAILAAVLDLERGGANRSAAVAQAAVDNKVAISAIWNWFEAVAGKDRADWLAWLTPRYSRSGKPASEIHPDAWDFFLADYLRLSKPSVAECWQRLQDAARDHGWVLPGTPKTLSRKLKREIDPEVITLRREGMEEFNRKYPAQRRDRSDLRALEALNYDGHKIDLFVEWPGGEIGRAFLLGFQDLSSNKILSWRLDTTENATGFRLAFGDVIENWGIPDTVFSDNTMAAAAKANTGGAKYRNRYKPRDDDFLGLFPALGIDLRFTKPGHGQSKPIERAFGELSRYISKAPEFEGAYTGNSPTNKPANYGARAVRMIDLLRVCEREINRYNARTDRNSLVAQGRSFDDVFNESYERDLIRKVAPEDEAIRRLWLLSVVGLTCRQPDGVLHLYGNRYYDPALARYIGRKVAVRYDPDRLGKHIHVYDLDGTYITAAGCIADSGFMDESEAKKHARARKARLRATRELADAQIVLNERDVARMLPTPDAPVKPEARVVKPQRFSAAATKPQPARLPESDPNALPDEFVNNVMAMKAIRDRTRL
ncbi:transposase domain-containing protein [Thalassobaculum sp. OXR-137]|uniref:transposase domain-containing protein n=1 Tax=Thalassobaculum sp. OXR-137 TaxID=3100173 RepID=UPI002AC93A52|nr:transposase domain-containing protein [Thalassobaculum sp. OXR-137]WPZ34909.1 transposase domain-containing protein [Thalassobaculum sp. OXR-137]